MVQVIWEESYLPGGKGTLKWTFKIFAGEIDLIFRRLQIST